MIDARNIHQNRLKVNHRGKTEKDCSDRTLEKGGEVWLAHKCYYEVCQPHATQAKTGGRAELLILP